MVSQILRPTAPSTCAGTTYASQVRPGSSVVVDRIHQVPADADRKVPLGDELVPSPGSAAGQQGLPRAVDVSAERRDAASTAVTTTFGKPRSLESACYWSELRARAAAARGSLPRTSGCRPQRHRRCADRPVLVGDLHAVLVLGLHAISTIDSESMSGRRRRRTSRGHFGRSIPVTSSMISARPAMIFPSGWPQCGPYLIG